MSVATARLATTAARTWTAAWEAPRLYLARSAAFARVEVQKLRHDGTELLTRTIQPALWLIIFGATFTRLDVIDTGEHSYLAYIAPGVIAQSGMFVAIFYGIHLIRERDSGILTKLLATPTPHSALVTGKAFAAGVRSLAQVVVIITISLLIGVSLRLDPLTLLGVVLAVVLGSSFFTCLSMTLAGLAKTQERIMGIGQAITMPLFFASSALYPVELMPGWLQWVAIVNPLTYQVDALRSLLLGVPTNLWLDFSVLAVSAVLAIAVAARVIGRLVR